MPHAHKWRVFQSTRLLFCCCKLSKHIMRCSAWAFHLPAALYIYHVVLGRRLLFCGASRPVCPMARWKARVEFLLSVIELLFLSLTVEALQGKRVKTRCLHEGVGHLEPRFQGKGSSPCQYIYTTRKAIDCAIILPLTFFLYIETLQQTFRPVLSQ